MSSLKPEDAVADYRGLDDKAMVVLNDWYSFFSYVPFLFIFLGSIEWLNTMNHLFHKGNDTTSLAKLLMVQSPKLMVLLPEPPSDL